MIREFCSFIYSDTLQELMEYSERCGYNRDEGIASIRSATFPCWAIRDFIRTETTHAWCWTWRIATVDEIETCLKDCERSISNLVNIHDKLQQFVSEQESDKNDA